MDRTAIISIVNEALSEEFELDKELLLPAALIRDDLHLDSLDIVDMVLALEQAFNFKLTDRSRILHIRTLQDIYDFIAELAAEGTIDKG